MPFTREDANRIVAEQHESYVMGQEAILALVIHHAIDAWPPGEGARAVLRIMLGRLFAPVADDVLNAVVEEWIARAKSITESRK